MEDLQAERDQKIENTALFIKSKRAFAKAIAGEIQSLQARKKAAERLADGAEKYLNLYMKGAKFNSPKVSVSWRISQAVEVENPEALPKEYQKVTVAADKVEIGRVLKAGGKVDGAELVQHTSIVLK